MKTYYFTVIFSLIFYNVFTQSYPDQKRDNIWLMGYDDDAVNPIYGVSKIDFNEIPPLVSRDTNPVDFDEATSIICDTSGNLLLYSNNLAIYNNSNDTIENGDINPNNLANDRLPQGNLLLPLPGHGNIYYLFHEEYTWVGGSDQIRIYTLYYSVIDMEANNGAGLVSPVNVPLIQDTLEYGEITSTKHGNGRDWWIIVPKANSNIYYKLLFSSTGVVIYNTQSIGSPVPAQLGQTVFSPDGATYARAGYSTFGLPVHLEIYNFDRCSGEFSNHRHIEYFPDGGTGVAISPNSRYLYFSVAFSIIQYDLWADDIEASGIVVAEYDGYESPFPTTFWLQQLAPDNKIYINCTNPTTVLHIIHSPDSAGLACNVEQHGLQLLTYNNYTIPNNPWFRLYAWDGSPCDTLNIDSTGTVGVHSPLVLSDVLVYPNPAGDYFNVLFSDPVFNARIELYDIAGREVLKQFLQAKVSTVDVLNLPKGLYLYSILDKEGEVIKTGKIVINYE
jgi:hypothetical protein